MTGRVWVWSTFGCVRIRIDAADGESICGEFSPATIGRFLYHVDRGKRAVRERDHELLIGGDSSSPRLGVWVRDVRRGRTAVFCPTPEEAGRLFFVGQSDALETHVVIGDGEPMADIGSIGQISHP